jgi:hypothetical protein
LHAQENNLVGHNSVSSLVHDAVTETALLPADYYMSQAMLQTIPATATVNESHHSSGIQLNIINESESLFAVNNITEDALVFKSEAPTKEEAINANALSAHSMPLPHQKARKSWPNNHLPPGDKNNVTVIKSQSLSPQKNYSTCSRIRGKSLSLSLGTPCPGHFPSMPLVTSPGRHYQQQQHPQIHMPNPLYPQQQQQQKQIIRYIRPLVSPMPMVSNIISSDKEKLSPSSSVLLSPVPGADFESAVVYLHTSGSTDKIDSITNAKFTSFPFPKTTVSKSSDTIKRIQANAEAVKYSFSNLELQLEFGRKVAMKLLDAHLDKDEKGIFSSNQKVNIPASSASDSPVSLVSSSPSGATILLPSELGPSLSSSLLLPLSSEQLLTQRHEKGLKKEGEKVEESNTSESNAHSPAYENAVATTRDPLLCAIPLLSCERPIFGSIIEEVNEEWVMCAFSFFLLTFTSYWILTN